MQMVNDFKTFFIIWNTMKTLCSVFCLIERVKKKRCIRVSFSEFQFFHFLMSSRICQFVCQDTFTELDECSFFPLRLILISSKSILFKDFDISNSFFWPLWNFIGTTFLLTYSFEKDLYHQQNDALYSVELP